MRISCVLVSWAKGGLPGPLVGAREILVIPLIVQEDVMREPLCGSLREATIKLPDLTANQGLSAFHVLLEDRRHNAHIGNARPLYRGC